MQFRSLITKVLVAAALASTPSACFVEEGDDADLETIDLELVTQALQNGSFETWSSGLPSSWSAASGATVAQVTGSAPDGTSVVAITTSSTSILQQTRAVTVPAGMAVSASVVARRDGATASNEPTVRVWVDYADATPDEWRALRFSSSFGASWSPAVMSFTPAAAIKSMTFSIMARGSSTGSSAKTLFDTASLTYDDAAGTPAPAQPATATATPFSSTQINLTWQDVSGETSYEIARGPLPTPTIVGSVGANVTSFAVTGLTASTTYGLHVRAVNASGSSAWRSVSATTLAVQPPPPPPPPPPAPGSGRIFTVGPDADDDYPTMVALLAGEALVGGDVVEVDGNFTYTGEVQIDRSGTPGLPITFRGVTKNGKRPLLVSGYRGFEVNGDHVLIENFEIKGGFTGCSGTTLQRTQACVFNNAHDLTIRESQIHDCTCNGIMGSDAASGGRSGSLTVDRVEIWNSGNSTQSHSIYVQTAIPDRNNDGIVDVAFRLQHSYIHDPLGGNVVKSRAARNEIYYNRIVASDPPGTDVRAYRELELIAPEGTNADALREDSDVVGNVFVHLHADSSMIRLGGDEPENDTGGVYRFVNNTFYMTTNVTALQAVEQIQRIETYNNVFANLGGAMKVFSAATPTWQPGGGHAGSNNWVPAGSTGVPPLSAWTAPIIAVPLNFANAGAYDLRPTTGSTLIGAGLESIPASQMSGVLAIPTYEPPPQGSFPVAAPRADIGTIDIGAYEAP